MGGYDLLMAPLEQRVLSGMRRQLIGLASGDVLELGAKTGANFPYYRWQQISSLTVSDLKLDPLLKLRAPAGTEIRQCSAHNLPFADSSFDTVLETLVFCSVSDLELALLEVYRVLRPGGRLLHLDHGLPASPALAVAFRGLNLLWPHLTGGCQLTRRLEQQLAARGFVEERLATDGLQIFSSGIANKPLG